VTNSVKYLIAIGAGILMASVHHFRWNTLEIEPGFISFLLGTAGLFLVLKYAPTISSARSRFLFGFLTGLSFFSIVMFWIVVALKEFGDLPLFIALSIGSCLFIYAALYWGAWTWIIGLPHVQSQSIGMRLWMWASSFAGLEMFREYLFTGFSYGEIGNHFSVWPWLAKSASIWGIHGLTFFWAFLAASLAHLEEWWQQRFTRRLVLGSWGLIVLIFVYGATISYSDVETKKVKVALIQPNIQQDMKWSSEKASEYFSTLVSMTVRASQSTPDLIVWPETAYPFLVQSSQRQLPFSSSIPVLVGAVVGDRGINRNSVLLVEGQEIQASFNKIHLVPFGEYVPFEEYLPFEKLVENVGRFVPGTLDQELLKTSASGIKMGPLVCYEDVFSRHSVRHAKKGAQLLVNLTNDAWYGKSSAMRQHADIANMQVYSTGLPMIRATNTGLSSVMSVHGRQDFQPEVEQSFITEVEVPISPKKTFFVQTFPLMQWIWWALFVIALVWKFRDPTRKIFFNKSLK